MKIAQSIWYHSLSKKSTYVFYCYTRPFLRKKSPPPTKTTLTTRRISRSLERKPEVINEEIVSYPITKTKGLFIFFEKKKEVKFLN
jgi:hypothetical protein